MLFYRIEDADRKGPYWNRDHSIFLCNKYDIDVHNNSCHRPPLEDGTITGTCGFIRLTDLYVWFKYEISYLNMHYHVAVYSLSPADIYPGHHQATIDDMTHELNKPVYLLKVKDAARIARSYL